MINTMSNRNAVNSICRVMLSLAWIGAGTAVTAERAGGPVKKSLYSDQRAALVRELRADGIADSNVLRAMDAVPRHRFVPATLLNLAYRNHPLPIGHEQTISQPYIVAIMTELALNGRAGRKLRVLEIGTGSGYQAAVLAELVGEVYTIEIIPELAASSAALLKKLGYRNVAVRCGDGYKGWKEKSPFDATVGTASPPEIPNALVAQLAKGGRMVVPVGGPGRDQSLTVIDKSDTGDVSARPLLPVIFVPMVRGDSE